MEHRGRVVRELGAEGLGHRPETRDVVDVGDRELGHARADARHQLRRRQRTSAEIEEVGFAIGDRESQDRLPLGGQPGLVGREIGCDRSVDARQRPRQRGTIDLPGRADGKLVDDPEQRDRRGGQAFGERRARGGAVEHGAVLHDEVADQDRHSGLGRAHGDGRGVHARQILQRRLDLAELDPAAADLHLVVGAALEDETLALEADEVARSVGPLPPQRRHRRVLLGILGGVEIPGEPHSPDDQLADLALGDGLPLAVDDRERPAVEREPDAHGRRSVQRCGARDHRRLGGAVGVPHLAPLGHEPGGEFGRTRLAAEDQQSDVLDRIRRPHRGEGGDRGDDRDALAQQPRREVLARADERARCGDETRTVPPREPHLLARRVEGDREPRQDTVARSERVALQEQPRLGLDEGRCRPVGDGHPLGHPGRTRREDDPGVVVDRRRRHDRDGVGAGVRSLPVVQAHEVVARRDELAVARDDAPDPGLAEHQTRTLVGIVGVHRHVGGAGGHHGEDRDVQLLRARRHPDTDPVAPAHAGLVQRRRRAPDAREGLGLCVGARAAVDGGGLGMPCGHVREDVDQRARRRSGARAVEHRRGGEHGGRHGGEAYTRRENTPERPRRFTFRSPVQRTLVRDGVYRAGEPCTGFVSPTCEGFT